MAFSKLTADAGGVMHAAACGSTCVMGGLTPMEEGAYGLPNKAGSVDPMKQFLLVQAISVRSGSKPFGYGERCKLLASVGIEK